MGKSALKTIDSDETGDITLLTNLALQFGAHDATVLTQDDILIDPRVRLKCLVPKCHMSGMCAHCPPYGSSNDSVRVMLKRVSHGIFFMVRVKSNIIANSQLAASIKNGVLDNDGMTINIGAYYLTVITIARILRDRARGMGFSPVIAFAAGDCRDILCSLQFLCRRTMYEEPCRVPELSFPSMESRGMNVYTMAAKAGWNIYPIGGRLLQSDVPHGSLMGLVLMGEQKKKVPVKTSEVAAGGRSAASTNSHFANFIKVIKREKDRFTAMKQYNMTTHQLRAVFREKRMWFRVLKNLREIQGSWSGALGLMMKIFEGRPR